MKTSPFASKLIEPKRKKMNTHSPASEKTAIIYHYRFDAALGGGEYLPLLFASELQKKGYSVIMAFDHESNLALAAKLYHIDLDTEKVKIMIIKPKNHFLLYLDTMLPFYRFWSLKKVLKKADICISGANIFDFGKPAHHIILQGRFLSDNAFSDFYMHRPPLKGFPLFIRKIRTFVAETFLRPLIGIRSTRKLLADPREHFYVPSRYVGDAMRAFYGPFNCTLLYPPTMFEISPMDVEREPFRVIYLGRIHPEKEIDKIIDIVDLARDLSKKPLTLQIAGYLKNNPYALSLQNIAEGKPWIQFVGPVFEEKKDAFLLSGTYAIHAERDEAFGISVTEYLKAGCISIVPDEGGTMEIVDNPDLTYHTVEEAAMILTHLVSDEEFRQKQLNRCKERAVFFSADNYMRRQHEVLDCILKGSK